VPAITYWYASLLTDYVLLIQSPVQSFSVATTPDTVLTLPVTWTVDNAASRPIHLWHLDPAGPLDGDTVTIYGQGFPATGTVTYGEIVLPTTSWQLVPESATNADDNTRLISGGTVTPEHYEVQFVAPVDDGPGDVLTVEV
jgi:hypothetical protein